MRNVPAIWDAWKGGIYVGETRPSTRVTVEKNWTLQQTASAVVGTWNRGPARWYQKAVPTATETEVPNVTSVNLSRGIDTDAGSCEVVVRNVQPSRTGDQELRTGQFGTPGYFTWDHGVALDSQARWGHVVNNWNEVLVPNALLRTYQGFGGTDKTIAQAVTDGNLVLNGVWLVDDVIVNTDGTLSIKCRDMGKLLIDQQLFPQLVPGNLYPLDYHRWVYKVLQITAAAPPGDHCFPCIYWASSTDDVYGEWNTGATGHPGTDAFDISPEPGPDIPGAYAHQRSYWLSEPKGDPGDTVWLEFNVNGGNAGLINQIYLHPWKGVIEGHGTNRVMVSVWENGMWVTPETALGGMTPEGIPYVCTFTPGTELAPATSSQRFPLPRDYQAARVRLTFTSLIWADDFPFGYGDPDYHGGGYRAGVRKAMACFATIAGEAMTPFCTLTGGAIPVNNNNRRGYWQVRANGQVYAFGDARVYDANSPASGPASTVIGMAVHPDGEGYWLVDTTGRVISAGSATHQGDLYGTGMEDVTDIAPTPSGNGYWLLRTNGAIHSFGDAVDQGVSTHSATMPTGAPAFARSLESHPSVQGYWILWIDGFVSCHNVADYGSAYDRTGFTDAEYVGSIRRTSTGAGYWVTSASGKVQAFGDAVDHGDAGIGAYDANRWYLGLCWELIPSSEDDAGYAIQSADGNLWVKGDPTGLLYGSVGTGTATQRLDGNYKDYGDIIRDLVLWSGFYLSRDPQPAADAPDVYGNIETTGAWADDPLAKEMFDKRPVMEAINEIKQIVGYAAFVDAEGGFRFESPNIWTLGNYLIDGTPLQYMPEIDESVQLTSHSVTRSANQARSRIVISTADPYPSIPGESPPKGVVTTEIIPRTASDLRGLVVPAMWINGKFLRKDEQKTMADLIDMRMWFARRIASVSCVANPLIDINDQVRVIERQSGEVYIHYVKGIQVNHDLTSGDFRMTLDTYWLGGSPYGSVSPFYTAAMRPQGDGYWTVTLASKNIPNRAGVYAYGAAQLYDCNETDSHTEFIMAMRATHTGQGYYTMDETGRILTFGDAVHRGNLSRPEKDVIDFALTPSGQGYWVLQKNGTVTCYGDATDYGDAVPSGVLPSGADVFAIAIEARPFVQGYWVLLTNGVVQNFHATHHGNANRDGFGSHDHTPCLRSTPTGDGYYIISAGGIVQAFGDATWRGNAPPDTSLNEWFYQIMWEILVAPSGGYGLLRAENVIVPFDFTVHPSSATAQRTPTWALVSPEEHNVLADPTVTYPVTANVMEFLGGTASPSANIAVVNNFAAPAEDVVKGSA